jgi:hypothetical protein
MIDLKSAIARIQELLDQDTPQHITYAALEARLALEKVCYDRLRQRHDYISNGDLKRWQPGYIMNSIIEHVDPFIVEDIQLLVGSGEFDENGNEVFIEIGTEIGVNPKKLTSLWNALSNLALHVNIPNDRNSQIEDYGDPHKIKQKIAESIIFLNEISKGLMTFSGFGEELVFDCVCGSKIRRRMSLIRPDVSVSCHNKDCWRSYKVTIDEIGKADVTLDSFEIPCKKCGEVYFVPRRELESMKFTDSKFIKCDSCSENTHVVWRLGYLK